MLKYMISTATRLRAVFLLGITLLPPGLLAAQQRAPSAAAVRRELDQFIRKGMRDWSIPGLSVAVVRNDSVLLVRGYGVQALGRPDSVTSSTLFGIMSTTKAFTAMAIAMLVDEGKLHWSDPVTRWIPEFALSDPFVTREITVKDLLTHNTGLGNADLLWARGDLSEAEIFHRLRDLPLSYSLRGGFAYQNVMYGLAGEVVARVSGMPYGEFLEQRIFHPLGLTRTYASFGAAHQQANLSSPHFRIRDTVRVIEESTVDVLPAAGALWSDADDMSRWLRFLLDSARVNGTRLVSDSSFKMLFAPGALVTRDEFYPTAELTRPHWMSYGLGWFQQDYAGQFVAFHTGSLDGRTAIIGLMPDRNIGIYAFGNLDHAEFRHALMLRAFDLLLGRPARDWSAELLKLYGNIRARGDSTRRAEAAKRMTGTGPSLALESYAGTYSHPVWGDLVVEKAGDSLALRMGTASELRGPLHHWNYDTFQAALGDGRSPAELAQFVIGTDGSVAELRIWGETFARKRE